MKTWSVGPRGEGLEDNPCPLCGSRERRPRLQGEGFRFVACRSCGLAYQHPRPVFPELRGRYREEYFRYELDNAANFYNLMVLGLGDAGLGEAAPGAVPGLAGDRFLDIGCATGMLVADMQSRGWKACGVEICRESAEYGIRERGVPIVIGTLEEAAFPEASFSIVHFSHLIEHVPDPRALLREVRRILLPGGLAVITTPNIDGLQARLFGARWRSAIGDHLALFSRPTLRRLLREEGYEIRRERTWGGLAVGTAPGWLKRPADRLAKRLGFGDVMLFLAARPLA